MKERGFENNKNLQQDKVNAESYIQFELPRYKKALFVKSAQSEKKKLSVWI